MNKKEEYAKLKDIWESVLLNFADIPQSNQFCFSLDRLNYIDIWILSKIHKLNNEHNRVKAFDSFLKEQVIWYYHELQKPVIYDLDYPNRDLCFGIFAYVFKSIFGRFEEVLGEPLFEMKSIDVLQTKTFTDVLQMKTLFEVINNESENLSNMKETDYALSLVNFIKSIVIKIKETLQKCNFEENKQSSIIKNARIIVKTIDDKKGNLDRINNDIRRLCGVKNVEVLTNCNENSYYFYVENTDCINREIEKIDNMIEFINTELERVNMLLTNPDFVQKAPSEKVTKEREKLIKYSKMYQKVVETKEYIEKLFTR